MLWSFNFGIWTELRDLQPKFLDSAQDRKNRIQKNSVNLHTSCFHSDVISYVKWIWYSISKYIWNWDYLDTNNCKSHSSSSSLTLPIVNGGRVSILVGTASTKAGATLFWLRQKLSFRSVIDKFCLSQNLNTFLQIYKFKVCFSL